MSYAVASVAGMPLLFTGEDFRTHGYRASLIRLGAVPRKPCQPLPKEP